MQGYRGWMSEAYGKPLKSRGKRGTGAELYGKGGENDPSDRGEKWRRRGRKGEKIRGNKCEAPAR